MTTLAAAVDTRLARSVAVAGIQPMYLLPDFSIRMYWILQQEVEYLDLFLLAAQNRVYVQVFNEFDNACFAGTAHHTYADILPAVATTAGLGEIDIFTDRSHITHQLSPFALQTLILPLLDRQ